MRPQEHLTNRRLTFRRVTEYKPPGPQMCGPWEADRLTLPLGHHILVLQMAVETARRSRVLAVVLLIAGSDRLGLGSGGRLFLRTATATNDYHHCDRYQEQQELLHFFTSWSKIARYYYRTKLRSCKLKHK